MKAYLNVYNSNRPCWWSRFYWPHKMLVNQRCEWPQWSFVRRQLLAGLAFHLSCVEANFPSSPPFIFFGKRAGPLQMWGSPYQLNKTLGPLGEMQVACRHLHVFGRPCDLPARRLDHWKGTWVAWWIWPSECWVCLSTYSIYSFIYLINLSIFWKFTYL